MYQWVAKGACGYLEIGMCQYIHFCISLWLNLWAGLLVIVATVCLWDFQYLGCYIFMGICSGSCGDPCVGSVAEVF